MKKSGLLAVVLFAISLCNTALAQQMQDKPIPFETLFGNERVAMALNINKSIAGKFRYNNVTSTAAYYDYEKGRTELVSVNSIVYQFHKNVGISGGIQYHFVKGFIPTFAVHFSHANPTWFFAITPYYNILPWANLETIAVAEYKPRLSENWRLFTRVQGFYSHDFEKNERERTMLYFRLGATYKKYTAGFGTNIDGYRPQRADIQNYGAFIRINI